MSYNAECALGCCQEVHASGLASLTIRFVRVPARPVQQCQKWRKVERVAFSEAAFCGGHHKAVIEIWLVRHHNGAVTAARFNTFTYNFKISCSASYSPTAPRSGSFGSMPLKARASGCKFAPTNGSTWKCNVVSGISQPCSSIFRVMAAISSSASVWR